MTAETALRQVEAEAQRRRRRQDATTLAARLLILGVGLSAWQLSSRGIALAGLSNPADIAAAWWKLLSSGLLVSHAQATLLEFAIGIVAGMSLGFSFAVLLTTRDLLYRVVEPYILALYGIPKIVLVPLFVLWFGTGLTTRVVMVGTVSLFLVLIATVAGLRSVRPELVAAIRLLGGGRVAIIRHAALPHALPFVLPALRVSIASSMGGAVLAEFLSGGEGLGYLLSQAADYLDNAQVMALVLTLGAIVFGCRLLLAPLERWVKLLEGTES